MLKTFLQQYGVKLACVAVLALAGLVTPFSVAQALHQIRLETTPSNPIPYGTVVTVNWACGDPSHVPQGYLRKRSANGTVTQVQTGTYYGYNYGLYRGHGIGGTYTTVVTENMGFSFTCSVVIDGRNNHITHPTAYTCHPSFGCAILPAWHQVTVGPPPPPPPPPVACTSAPNICGQTTSGIVVGGVCNATTPSNSSCPCTSAANSCGMTNSGHYLQNGQCSVTTPPNSSCPATPTVTISAGAGNGVDVSRPAGTAVTITATFAAGSGDTLTGAAINGPNRSSSVPGGNTNPAARKTYTLPASTPAGSYSFRPAARTTRYPTWSDYGADVVVTLTAPTCSDPNAINPPTCTCSPGFQRVPPSTTCTLIPVVVPPALPTLSLVAADDRVRQGTPAHLTWAVSNLLATDSCSIASNPLSVFSRSQAAGPTSWGGANVATGNLSGQTTFTLSCTRGTAVTITVNILPSII